MFGIAMRFPVVSPIVGTVFCLLAAPSSAAEGDLWNFTLTTIEGDAATKGMWADPFTIGTGSGAGTGPKNPYNVVHAALLKYQDEGRIVCWRDTLFTFYDLNKNAASDPGAQQEISLAGQASWDDCTNGQIHHAFCAGHTFLPDGRLFMAGGDRAVTTDQVNCTDPSVDTPEQFAEGWASIVDASGATPTVLPTHPSRAYPYYMLTPKWYPTCITLPSGNILVTGGDFWDPDEDFAHGDDHDFKETMQSYHCADADDPPPPPPGRPPNELGCIYEWEEYDVGTNQFLSAYNLLDFDDDQMLDDQEHVKGYSHFQVLPNNLFWGGYPGWNPTTGFKNPRAYTWPWSDLQPSAAAPLNKDTSYQGGSCVLLSMTYPYDHPTIVFFGGQSGTSYHNTVEFKDYGTGNAWAYSDNMAYDRHNLDTVLLADGTVLAVGGEESNQDDREVLVCEIYDHNANPGSRWTIVDALANPRQYHSVALLLPDGRVFVAGNQGGQAHGDPMNEERGYTYELYYPPYLFDGTALATRPTIESVPASIEYGIPFAVDVVISHDLSPPIGRVFSRAFPS